MIAQAPWYLGPVVSFVLGGGLLAAVYALLKIRPEAGQFTVTAAQGVVVMQTGLIDSLREDLDEAREEIKGLKTQADQITRMQWRITQLEEDLKLERRRCDQLAHERDDLKGRVADLEAEVAKLKGGQ